METAVTQPPAKGTPEAPKAKDAKLAALRAAMARADGGAGVAAYIIPTEDPHNSETPPKCYARREFITGFTGSAGTAVVTAEHALLWTDGRYFLQAESQLGPEWQLMRSGTPGCPEIADWLGGTLEAGDRVGIDPFLHTIERVKALKTKLEEKDKVLVPLLADGNLVDSVWGSERPEPPPAPVRVHPIEWAGETVATKLEKLRVQLQKASAGAVLVTTLDGVAWLLNLRGGDIKHSPVFISNCIVTADTAAVYMDGTKVPADAAAQLSEAGVDVKAPSQLIPDVKALVAADTTLWMDPAQVSYALYQAAEDALAPRGKAAAAAGSKGRAGSRKRPAPNTAPQTPPKLKTVQKPSPVEAAKALKNEAELSGMREAHLRDAAAICEFLCWVEAHIASGQTLTEWEVDRELTARRAAQPGFVELSFATIAGAGPNGAIIHYKPAKETSRVVDGNTLLLLDSGGQYECGTTDITRTMHFGQPSAHQSMAFTRVLQGHIALDKAVFPQGTYGMALDTLARVPLWNQGLNYRHGTGHGVGAVLNVHEGPQGISTRVISVPLEVNMVCSNEPGYYEDGAFGVRIENLVVVKEVDTEFRFGGIPFFGFEMLTLVPIQTKMCDETIMTKEEVAWLDGYHQKVWEAVSPRVSGATLEWLRKNTMPLQEQQQNGTAP